MIECIIVQFIMGYNPHTTEYHQLYRCRNEYSFRYLQTDRRAIGFYSIEDEVIILEEPLGL